MLKSIAETGALKQFGVDATFLIPSDTGASPIDVAGQLHLEQLADQTRIALFDVTNKVALSEWRLPGSLQFQNPSVKLDYADGEFRAGMQGGLVIAKAGPLVKAAVGVELVLQFNSINPPKHLRITQTMLEDLLLDPVMAAWVFFKIKLDAFQAVRLRICWFTPDVQDHSGFTSGKTIVDCVWCNLSADLLYDCHIGAIFQTFQIGKDNFNQHHPAWCNKVVRSATAELGNHPGFRVHREYEREVKRGNPDYWAFGFN